MILRRPILAKQRNVFKEYKNSIKNSKPKVSSFAKHSLDKSHQFDFKSIEVLVQETGSLKFVAHLKQFN